MKRQRSLCGAQNADTRSGNTLNFGKLFRHVIAIRIFSEQNSMPKKEKPLTKKERDEKSKAKKAKQSKTQTS